MSAIDADTTATDTTARSGAASEDSSQDSTPPSDFAWIDLCDTDDVSAELGRLGVPELAIEDVVEADQQPKIEAYDAGLFFVIDAATYDDASESITFHQLRIYFTRELIVTVAPETLGVSRRLHRAFSTDRWSPATTAEVAYTLIDRVVDGYEPVIAGLSVDVVQVEADVFSPEATNPSERIYYLKRQVLAFTRHTAPFAAPLDRLRVNGHHAVPAELDDYYRDVEDHLNQATQQLDQYSDLLNGALDANLAQISVRQNEDMRRMSAWAAIFLLPTLLAGIWGMNFSAMPETDWRWGYPLALTTMTLATGYLYLRLKRSGWL